MKISLGPIYYYWPKYKVYKFYEKIAKSNVDIVYLGEVICSKRHELKLEDWFTIADQLTQAGKEVVLSTSIPKRTLSSILTKEFGESVHEVYCDFSMASLLKKSLNK